VSHGAPDEGVVITTRRGPVTVLTLNRPDRMNAWTRRMQEEYFDALEHAESDPDVRAVVLTGSGGAFCAGADMAALDRVGSGDPKARRVLDRPTSLPLFFRKPLLAAVNGACAGMGLVQALYCDLRFVAHDAKLTTAYARRGLIAEHGISWLLPRITGYANAMDLLLSGRAVVGDEALALGLANRLCDPGSVLEDGIAYATELAERSSPAAMAVIKRQIRLHAASSLQEAVDDSRRLMLASYDWPDLREGVASFRERRVPRFPPLRHGSSDQD